MPQPRPATYSQIFALAFGLGLSLMAAAQQAPGSNRAAAQTGKQAESGQTPSSSSSSAVSRVKHLPSSVAGGRRIPGHPAQHGPGWAALLGKVQSADGIPLGGVQILLTPLSGKKIVRQSTADGIFRISGVPPAKYQFTFQLPGFDPLVQSDVVLNAGEVLTIEVKLHASGMAANGSGAPLKRVPAERTMPESNLGTEESETSDYHELFRRPVEEMHAQLQAENVPDTKVLVPDPDRWDPSMPAWLRYDRNGEFPYTSSHWWDPFNQNRIKSDKPIFGQSTFFNFTGTSTTAFDVRNLFVPSGVSAERSGSTRFFGRGGQVFVEETVRLSFDLFHGDTSFKPVDWRIKVTPAFNINQIWTKERGIVNIDVRQGTNRTDGHIGLQEAFAEKKIADLGPNYDFISVRAGIQQFTSDFRGLLFTQEQPGVRVFGNLRSNRLQYNAAYFFFLEKDTNSGLNTFQNRHQQVLLANFYMQDFLTKGYTTQFSYHYNKDDASTHFDNNGFLVRPAPIGSVRPHNIRAHYIGWTGNGHIKKLNISHAFYQALGHDDLNPIAGRRVDINAQMGALELSLDKDWVRFRASAFFASGDDSPRDRVASGFDAISEAQTFAGGVFSFFNREGIRLTGTGVALVAPDSFLPNLRSSKEEGQANFVNPGILMGNVGADFNITPKVRAMTNVNYMRFHHTEPLELLLFQPHINQNIGLDYSLGIIYRPPLSENMVITGGVAALTPFTGLRRIYTGKTLVSAFATVRFQF